MRRTRLTSATTERGARGSGADGRSRPLKARLVVIGAAMVVASGMVGTGFTTVAGGEDAAAAQSSVAGDVRVRKNVKNLSDAERRKFVQALLALKRAPSPLNNGLSYYDQFVQWHKDLYVCEVGIDHHLSGHHPMQMGHNGPMFLPWHRAYVLRLEDALRQVSGTDVSVPYWDWTDEASTNAMFADDLMGPRTGDPNENFIVKSGPFGKDSRNEDGTPAWPLNVHPEGAQWSHSASPFITRRAGSFPGAPEEPWKRLPAQLASALASPRYDVAPYDSRSTTAETPASNPEQWSFRNRLEGFPGDPGVTNAMECGPDGWMTVVGRSARLHNYVHVWVGGLLSPSPSGDEVMGTMVVSTSPNDPIFFLHHSNIDRLWWQWQQSRGIHTYEPVSGYPLNNVDSVMVPWGTTPAHVADIRALNYRYK